MINVLLSILIPIIFCIGMKVGLEKEERYSKDNRIRFDTDEHHKIFYIGKKRYRCSTCSKKYKDERQAIFCC